MTYNFLQAERRRHLAGLTFPVARAIVQEIFTADLFAPRPFYLKRIEALSRCNCGSNKVVLDGHLPCGGVDWCSPSSAVPLHRRRRMNVMVIY